MVASVKATFMYRSENCKIISKTKHLFPFKPITKSKSVIFSSWTLSKTTLNAEQMWESMEYLLDLAKYCENLILKKDISLKINFWNAFLKSKCLQNGVSALYAILMSCRAYERMRTELLEHTVQARQVNGLSKRYHLSILVQYLPATIADLVEHQLSSSCN